MTDFALAPLGAVPLSATDRVFQALYDAVISLQLPPGTKVSEVEVARQLAVSRQPVRDAFFRLGALGFLAIRPQRPTLITPISEQAVRDAVFTRTALEAECLRAISAPGTAPEAGAALRAELSRQAAALPQSDTAGYHALDEDFHRKLCQLAGHAHVWSVIREQKAHMDRVRYLSLSEQRKQRVLDEHTAIVEAVAAGDGAAAEAALRAHLNGVLTVLPELRARHPDYFETRR